jgi:hypothetical protein
MHGHGPGPLHIGLNTHSVRILHSPAVDCGVNASLLTSAATLGEVKCYI